jgi:hypothetical protein
MLCRSKKIPAKHIIILEQNFCKIAYELNKCILNYFSHCDCLYVVQQQVWRMS